MRINIIQPMMSRQSAPVSISRFLQPVQNTAYLLAALVPPEHEVRVTDEFVRRADPSGDDSDLVAITFITPFAPRVYDLARQYRLRGATVVFGGPHTTLVPGEAAQHADAIVLGEGDLAFPELIADAAKGQLRRVYRSAHPPDPALIPPSRHDLVRPQSFWIRHAMQASRGCPFRCDFCSLPGVYGKGFRPRPIRKVVEELESLDLGAHSAPIVFWDDNIVGHHPWARRLFRELAPLKIRWLSQSTITIAEDPELLRLASRSGCQGLFCGLESFSASSLQGVRKAFNRVQDYKEKLQRLHDHGIAVGAGMVFGFDGDTPDIFDISYQAAEEMALDAVSAAYLVPFPGTPLYDRMTREGRILTRNWELYDGEHVVVRPLQMTPEQLDRGMRRFRRQFYSARSIWRRLSTSRTQLHISGPANLAYAFVARNGGAPQEIPNPISSRATCEPTHQDVLNARVGLPVFNGWV